MRRFDVKGKYAIICLNKNFYTFEDIAHAGTLFEKSFSVSVGMCFSADKKKDYFIVNLESRKGDVDKSKVYEFCNYLVSKIPGLKK